MKKILFILTLSLLCAGMSWAQNVFNTNSGNGYDDLQTAIDAATAGDSLVVLADLNVNDIISVTKNLIINGGKHNINTTATRGLWTDASGVNLTLRNFNLNGGTATNRGIQVNDPNVTIVMDSCNIIMQGSNYAILALEYDLGNNPNENLHMTVTNSYIKGLTALRSFAPEANFTFVNDTLHGVNPYNNCPSSGNNFAVIMLCGDAAYGDGHGSENTNISFENCVIIAEEQGNCSEEWIGFVDGTTNASGIVDANTKILDGNENDITEEVNMSDGGPGNSITMPLTITQFDKLVNDPYVTVINNGNGTWTLSANVYYDWTTGGVYCDFHSPFKEGWLADDETINLLENVTMTENLTPGIVKFTLKFNGKTITKGDYCIMLEEGDTVITDAQTDIFCADAGRVVETDNGDGTYTYSMAKVYNATQNKGYSDLQPAIDAAAAGDSIVVMSDLNINALPSKSVSIEILKSLVINGGKHTITSTATRGLWVNASNVNLTLRNFYLDCTNTTEEGVRGVQLNGMDGSVFSNNTLLMDSCRVTTAGKFGKSYAMNLTCYGHDFTVTVKNSYIKGWAALNSYAKDIHFVFENDTLHGVNQLSTSSWDDFATINLDGGSNNSCGGVGTGSSNVTVDITNSVVIAEQQGTCKQYWATMSYGGRNVAINVDCNTKIVDGPATTANDVSSNFVVHSSDNFGNTYTRGTIGNIVVKLDDNQKLDLEGNNYTLQTVTGDCERTRVSHSAYYKYEYNSTNYGLYMDFHKVFNNLTAGGEIDLLENVTMTQEVYAPFDGNFTLHFKDGSEEHSITQGDYTIVLDDDQTCTTDKQALALFSSINGSSITETDNNNGTWTYSVTPYNIITYYSNNSADEEDAQTKPKGETVNLYDYKTFDHADSTIYRWNTQADGNGTDYALGAAYSADDDLDLYAVWLLNLNMTMDSTDVVCYGENNGTDTVKIIGGEAPFQIVLSSTVMAENDTVKNLMDRTHIFTNLKPGKYNVQLTDVLKKDTIRGTFTIAQPDTLEITALTVPEDFPCPLMGNGSYDVSVTAQGGNGGYHYTWSEAAVNIDAAATTVVSGADDRDSIYTVKVVVTDSKNCTAEGIKTFTVSKVIADDGTVHSNSKLTIDTIRVGIMSGCDTVYKEYGTPVFTTTIPGGYPEDRLTIVNNIATAYPDSVFYLGENKIIWTATDTCGHSITGEQVLIVYHFPCPNVTDVDGNDYPSVRLGCDCWMAENLKTTKYSDGRAISNLMKYESPTHPDADANFAIYGYLYDWTAALDAENGVTMDAEGLVQGICPTGWHMPTDLDFANVAGVQGRHDISDLRSTDYWLDGGGNNSTNFNLLPGGFYNDNTARYENILGEAYLWSVNSADPSQPKVFWADCHCYMWQVGDPSANMGASVRCVKD